MVVCGIPRRSLRGCCVRYLSSVAGWHAGCTRSRALELHETRNSMKRSGERWEEPGIERDEEDRARLRLVFEEAADAEASSDSALAKLGPWLWGAALAGGGLITLAALRARKQRRIHWPLVVRVSLESPREPRSLFAIAGGALARLAIDRVLVAAQALALEAAERAGAAADAPVAPAEPSPAERPRSTENGHPRL